jgi:hypothetical protein
MSTYTSDNYLINEQKAVAALLSNDEQIDQQYVFDRLPLNKMQRDMLYNLLIGKLSEADCSRELQQHKEVSTRSGDSAELSSTEPAALRSGATEPAALRSGATEPAALRSGATEPAALRSGASELQMESHNLDKSSSNPAALD